MKPLAKAINKGYTPDKFRDPFRHDPAKTCQINTDRSSPLRALRKKMLYPDIAAEEGPPRRRVRSDLSLAGTPTSSARRRHAAAAAADLARASSSGELNIASARRSARGSARAATAQASARSSTTRRLQKIEEALERERQARQTLSQSLEEERRQRQAVEENLRQMRASLQSQQMTAQKLAQYEKIMGKLVKVRRLHVVCGFVLRESAGPHHRLRCVSQTVKGAEGRASARRSARSGMRSSRSSQHL